MVERLTGNLRIANSISRLRLQADRLQLLDFEEWDELRRDEVRRNIDIDVQDLSRIGYKFDERTRRLALREFTRSINREVHKDKKSVLQKKYKDYVSMMLDKGNLLSEERTGECFTKLFKICSRLDSVVIAMRKDPNPQGWRCVKQFRDVVAGPYGDDISSRIGYRSLLEVLAAADQAEKSLKRLEIAPISHQFFSPSKCCGAPPNIFHALAKVRELHLGLNDVDLFHDREECGEGIDELWPLDRTETPKQAFRRVIASYKDGRLARCLSENTTLTELNIMAPRQPKGVKDVVPMSCLVGQIRWQSLSSLSLSNFECEGPDLANFIVGHKLTLEMLSLCNVNILEITVEACFDAFAGKLPNLRQVSLRGRLKTRASDRMYPHDLYLSHKAAPDRAGRRASYTRELETYVLTGGKFHMNMCVSELSIMEYSSDNNSDYDPSSDDDDFYWVADSDEE